MTFFLSFPEGTAFQNKVPGQFLIHSFPSISKAIVDKVQGRLCAALQKGKKIKNEATVTSERATFFPPFPSPPFIWNITLHHTVVWKLAGNKKREVSTGTPWASDKGPVVSRLRGRQIPNAQKLTSWKLCRISSLTSSTSSPLFQETNQCRRPGPSNNYFPVLDIVQ